MALIIENISGALLSVDDIGIVLTIGATLDLSLEVSANIIALSATSGDLNTLISSGTQLVVKDPIGGANLSIADGIAALQAAGDGNWRLGAGSRINDLSDVTETALATDQVLQYNGSQWVNVDPATVGAGASIQLEWKFSTTITAADPGSTRFRYNNATLASVTEIYVSDIALSGVDASTILNQLDVGDKLYIQQKDLAASAALFTIVSVTDNVGWFTIVVTVDDSGTLHQNNKDCGWILLFSAAAAAAASHFSGNNNSVTQTFTAPTTINFGTIVRSDSDYTEAADVGGTAVTINTTGWYEITYEVSVDGTTGSRTICQSEIQVNGVFLAGTRAFSYHRNTSAGEGTNTATIKANLTATDVVRVQSQVIAGSAVQTVAEGCRLNIRSIDGP